MNHQKELFLQTMEELTMVKDYTSAAKDFFERYTAEFIRNKDFDISESMILKKEHCLRVARLCAKIATSLHMEEEEVSLAETIGLLHDIGRFAQFEKHQTFDDLQSEDHAEIGLTLLNEQMFFSSYPEEMQKNIVGSIRNHNKESISLKDDKQVVLFSKILRDADKLDIWETCIANLQRNGTFRLESISLNLPPISTVNEMVIRTIKQGKSVKRKELHSINDYKLMIMSLVFDLNFRISFHLLSEKQLIKKLYDSMPKKDVVIDAYRELRLYIENKFVE
jgi:putative nucleotidyltransferase with HDIG domain